MRTLHLPLKREYFEAIRDGTKFEEYRACARSTGANASSASRSTRSCSRWGIRRATTKPAAKCCPGMATPSKPSPTRTSAPSRSRCSPST